MNRKEYELDPQLQSDHEILRTDRLRQRYGSDSEPWDKEFGGLDNSADKARAAALRMKNYLAASGVDPDKPMRFSVTVAGRSVPIQVRQQENGEFTCDLPVEIQPGHFEYRTIIADSYENLIGGINRALSSGPRIRDLTAEETLELARMCASGQNIDSVVWRYLEYRIGKVEDVSALLRDPKYVCVTNDCALFVFSHTEPSFSNSPEAVEYIRRYAGSRPLTVPLCKAAFAAYQRRETSAEQARLIGLPQDGQIPTPPTLTEAELESATDREIRESLRGIARERGSQAVRTSLRQIKFRPLLPRAITLRRNVAGRPPWAWDSACSQSRPDFLAARVSALRFLEIHSLKRYNHANKDHQ
jgi:hypothetical protein